MSTDLLETFTQAVQYFNQASAASYANLLALLTSDVVMKKVDDPFAYYNTPGVTAYFSAGGGGLRDEPSFRPTTVVVKRIGPAAFIHGVARWQDSRTPAPAAPFLMVEYSFVLVQDAANNWFIEIMWAHII